MTGRAQDGAPERSLLGLAASEDGGMVGRVARRGGLGPALRGVA